MKQHTFPFNEILQSCTLINVIEIKIFDVDCFLFHINIFPEATDIFSNNYELDQKGNFQT